MENEVDYVPFGPEWEREMMKWNKRHLIGWIRRLLETHEEDDLKQKFFRETVMRANLALPESEEDLKWFEEGINAVKNPEFIEMLFTMAGLGELKFKQA